MVKSLLCPLALLVAFVCLFMAGHNPQAAAQLKSAAKAATAPATAKAAQLYRRDCALCHGDNGNGKTELVASMNLTLDDWTDPQTLGSKPDSALFAIVRNGKDKMPAEENGRASDAEVMGLIAYIRGFAKAAPATPPPAHAAN